MWRAGVDRDIREGDFAMSHTILRAKAGEFAVTTDGTPISPTEIDVIDLETGKTPVDAQGRTLYFTEVDVEKGIGIAFDNDHRSVRRGEKFIEVAGRFELRYRPSAEQPPKDSLAEKLDDVCRRFHRK